MSVICACWSRLHRCVLIGWLGGCLQWCRWNPGSHTAKQALLHCVEVSMPLEKKAFTVHPSPCPALSNMTAERTEGELSSYIISQEDAPAHPPTHTPPHTPRPYSEAHYVVSSFHRPGGLTATWVPLLCTQSRMSWAGVRTKLLTSYVLLIWFSKLGFSV